MERITASLETLMKQSSFTADIYFEAAKKIVDDTSGKYSNLDVQVMCELIRAQSYDFRTSAMLLIAQEMSDQMTEINHNLSELTRVLTEE